MPYIHRVLRSDETKSLSSGRAGGVVNDSDRLSDGLELGVTTGAWTANVAPPAGGGNVYPLANGNFENGNLRYHPGHGGGNHHDHQRTTRFETVRYLFNHRLIILL